MIRQLTLDIRPISQPSLDNFVVGENIELVERLRALLAPLLATGARDAVYLWGPTGSGRTHLLTGARAAAEWQHYPVICFGKDSVEESMDFPHSAILIVDNVDQLSALEQTVLFRAFNLASQLNLSFVLSGSEPPLGLALREDLRTRIGSCLIYELKPLSDMEKATTLALHAQQRGIWIDEDLIEYLLHHAPRDLPSLLGILETIDDISLEQKRSVTLPLIREALQQFLQRR